MNNKLPKVALFDLDATLMKTNLELYYRCLHSWCIEHNIEVSLSSIRESCRNAKDFSIIPDDLKNKFIYEDFSSLPLEDIYLIEEIKGVASLLKKLSCNGIPVAIVTARPESSKEVWKALKNTSFLNFIDYIITRGVSLNYSNKKDTIQYACAHFGFKPSDAFMVGDQPHDISSALEVGVKQTFGVETGNVYREVLEKAGASKVFADINGIKDYFGL